MVPRGIAAVQVLNAVSVVWRLRNLQCAADWEHVTMRLSPDAQKVLGVYFSAHR